MTQIKNTRILCLFACMLIRSTLHVTLVACTSQSNVERNNRLQIGRDKVGFELKGRENEKMDMCFFNVAYFV